MFADNNDRRVAERSRRSDVLLWTDLGDSDFKMGWLLEASETGFAFAWRGDVLPSVGSLISVQTDSLCPEDQSRRARVIRVEIAHDNLAVIAAHICDESPKMNEAAAALIEPKPYAESVPTDETQLMAA